MAIENRNLEPGTRLVATYKKQAHVCTVERDDEGSPRYRLEDGREFKSPSAAGSAVMGGVACNGWRFWSVEGAEPQANEAPAKEESAARKKGKRLIRRTPNQQGMPDSEVRWFCDACMGSFTAPAADGEPDVCPQGHRADDPQLVGAP